MRKRFDLWSLISAALLSWFGTALAILMKVLEEGWRDAQGSIMVWYLLVPAIAFLGIGLIANLCFLVRIEPDDRGIPLFGIAGSLIGLVTITSLIVNLL